MRRTVVNELPALLAAHDVGWDELGRRTLLSRRTLDRLRGATANPRLRDAHRIADALGVAIEQIWTLRDPAA